eukprot:SAG11_NODE_13730_length_642_cov_0.854512_2_plen_46_part_01
MILDRVVIVECLFVVSLSVDIHMLRPRLSWTEELRRKSSLKGRTLG